MRCPIVIARKQKLKVYRTPIGFHDACAAATSQKEALKAWGADVDLFERGVAELVTDDALMPEVLEKPGAVVRRARGTSAEHMAPLPNDRPRLKCKPEPPASDEGPALRRASRKHAGGSQARSPMLDTRSDATSSRTSNESAEIDRAKPKPGRRPYRSRPERAEKAVEQAKAEHDAAIAETMEKEKALQTECRRLEAEHEKRVTKLDRSVASARDSYGEALRKWRS